MTRAARAIAGLVFLFAAAFAAGTAIGGSEAPTRLGAAARPVTTTRSPLIAAPSGPPRLPALREAAPPPARGDAGVARGHHPAPAPAPALPPPPPQQPILPPDPLPR
jgi:hypothetical protein